MRLVVLVIIFIFIVLNSMFSQNDYQNWLQHQNIPRWVYRNFKLHNLHKEFDYNFSINPFYLRGDFNGDDIPDIAVSIRNIESKKLGIVIFHDTSPKYYVIAAGRETFRSDWDDFKNLQIWRVYYEGIIPENPYSDPPELLGEAIYFAKPEAASGIVYWTGSEYRWYQLGD